MMPLTAKRKIRLAALVLGGVVALGAFTTLSRVEDAVSSRNEVEEIFNPAAELPEPLLEAVAWEPDPDDLVRPMEPLTREDLTKSWLRAWEQVTVLAQTGDASGLDDYWSGSGLEQVMAVDWSGATLQQRAHRLELEFYAADGQVIALRATSDIARAVRGPDDWVWWFGVEEYDVVLVLRDGNWRVEQLVRTRAEGDYVDPEELAEAATGDAG